MAGGDEEVVLQHAAQHQPQDERRPRPAEALHEPTQEGEGKQQEQVAEVPLGLERGQEHDYDHQRRQQVHPDTGEAGQGVGEEQAQAGAEDVGDGDAPHHGVGHVQAFGEHFGTRADPLDQEHPEQYGHGGAAGHAEGQGGDQGAALLGVVGALRRDDAADVARAERVPGAALGLGCVPVGEPVHHRAAQTRGGAHPHAHGAGPQHQEPVAEGVPDACGHALEGVSGNVGDARAADHQVHHLRDGEDPQGHGHQRHALPEVELAEGPAHLSHLVVHADHARHEAQRSHHQPLEGRAAAQHRHHGDAQHAHHEELGGAEGEHDGTEDRYGDGQDQRPEEPSQHGGSVGGAKGPARLPPPGHGMAVQDGGLRSRSAGNAEEHRRDRVRGAGHRDEPHHDGERVHRVQIQGERQQDGEPHEAAETRDGSQGEAHDHAQQQEGQALRDQVGETGATEYVLGRTEGCIPHGFRCPGARAGRSAAKRRGRPRLPGDIATNGGCAQKPENPLS